MRTRSVITIGNFDGVHRGHRAILGRARRLADAESARLIVLTFDPHPAAVLRPGSQPPVLTTTTRRVELLMEAGADQVHLLRPTQDVLGLSPEAFVDRLVEEFSPLVFVEGQDFRFGKGRAGDIDTLRRLGEQRGGADGFAVELVDGIEVTLGDRLVTPVSSSLIRWLVGRGRVADAALCLGQCFALDSTVVRGEQRGRQIGVPTINLDLAAISDHILPADGVYAGVAWVQGAAASGKSSAGAPSATGAVPFTAAISVGVKPTFGKRSLTIEAHLLDYHSPDPDALYGQGVRLSFAHWLRDQYAFPDVEALKSQLKRDIDRTRHRQQATNSGDNLPTPSQALAAPTH